MKTQNQIKRAFAGHFPKEISSSVVDYAEKCVLSRSNYIFTHRNKLRMQYAYCTACNSEYKTDGSFKEKGWSSCWKCKENCYVRASGRSRNKLYHSAYFVFYEKSLLDPQAITATGYWAKRDYRGSYKDVPLNLEVKHRYIFVPGEKARMYSLFQNNWYEESSTRSMFGGMYYDQGYTMANRFLSEESVRTAIIGTPYQYSMWENYKYQDMVKFFSIFSLYPCIEYLTKLGMGYFVNAKLYGNQPTYGAINWRGKSVNSVLKISKQQLKEIEQFRKQEQLHPLTLRLQQIVGKDRKHIPLSQLQEIAKNYDSSFEHLKKLLKYTTLNRAVNYVEKQKGLLKRNRSLLGSTSEVLTFWKDYIADCLKLEQDPNDDQILFPRNIYEAHQQMIERVRHKEDAALNEQIAARMPLLQKKYGFQLENLMIRPIKDTAELIYEGKVLKHCVGGYAKRYADGNTILLAIRRLECPNEPFYTMEISSDKVLQCRGFKNKSTTPDVEKFVEQFKNEKLTKNQKQKAVAV